MIDFTTQRKCPRCRICDDCDKNKAEPLSPPTHYVDLTKDDNDTEHNGKSDGGAGTGVGDNNDGGEHEDGGEDKDEEMNEEVAKDNAPPGGGFYTDFFIARPFANPHSQDEETTEGEDEEVTEGEDEEMDEEVAEDNNNDEDEYTD